MILASVRQLRSSLQTEEMKTQQGHIPKAKEKKKEKVQEWNGKVFQWFSAAAGCTTNAAEEEAALFQFLTIFLKSTVLMLLPVSQ